MLYCCLENDKCMGDNMSKMGPKKGKEDGRKKQMLQQMAALKRKQETKTKK